MAIAEISRRKSETWSGLLGPAIAGTTAVVLTVRAMLAARAEEATVAGSILNSEPVVRAGNAAYLVGPALYGALALIAHYVLAPVRLSLGLLDVYFRILARAISAADLPLLVHLAPLLFKLAMVDMAHAAHAVLQALF